MKRGTYIVTVSPITKGVGKDTLSYFSGKRYSPGSIITVPLRKKEVPALVVEARQAQKEKSSIRKASFAVRKLTAQKETRLFSKDFLKAVEQTSLFHASSFGSTLHALVPKAIIETPPQYEILKTRKSRAPQESFIFQAETPERISEYKSIVREEFAKKKSAFLCVPTQKEIPFLKESLEKGIEPHVYVLHGSQTKKTITKTWKNIFEANHPVLIISTGLFLGVPCKDLGTIIIENESNDSYKRIDRPFIDIRIFAEYYAKTSKTRLIWSDTLLRTETLWKYHEGDFLPLTPPSFRYLSSSERKVVSISQRGHEKKTKEFILFSEDIKKRIESVDEGKKIILFTNRKGLFPLTLCNDCKEVVSCKECSRPVVLYRRPKGNHFVCHSCGSERDADEKCKVCGGWKLSTVGIGINLVEEVLRKHISSTKLFVVDPDKAKTPKRVSGIIEKFEKANSGILLTTELGLLQISKPVDHVAVISIDSLFAIPDFKMNEHIFRLLLRLRSLSKESFTVQTRNEDLSLFDLALQGNLLAFYRQEIQSRKDQIYPPFVIFIKCTIKGGKESVREESARVEEFLKEYKPDIYPAFVKKVKNKTIVHILLTLRKDVWPDKKLSEKLLSLPLSVSVDVSPKSLL